ncbi:hypothetical protein [Streptomyces avermitilis]|uniref:DNA-binding protein n=2 Tax=Streptomyces avermitilis TaxID=33903 RepID=A0A143SZD0_STRAW|nr:hypothetical protein [Streptomyces avermitilis]BAU77517.1 hypothetical protein SAVERM_2p073 [Streptomyces avermitilis MA-4680 = NBRC 14893]BBJ56265.1 hypothetical protein SAVMC3_88940 [Streptomyces avermitilis]GDY70186.1 hypothetical protein SAV14893_095790 [Streptomyces avermitilis]GDY80485.1 hypothetical protein SAV31267_099700 [Streptomyces avermitilis]
MREVKEPRRALAETVGHIDLLLEGRTRGDVLDVHQLAIDSGEPEDVIAALLQGQTPPAEDIADRIIRRIELLRQTRRRPDGSRHSYEEIAASFGASRAALAKLANSRKNPKHTPAAPEGVQRPARASGPLASTQAGIEKFFFGQPNGWLSAEPESALNAALQPVLDDLRTTAGAVSHSGRRAVTLRSAAGLPDDKWELLEGVINTLVQQARQQQNE